MVKQQQKIKEQELKIEKQQKELENLKKRMNQPQFKQNKKISGATNKNFINFQNSSSINSLI